MWDLEALMNLNIKFRNLTASEIEKRAKSYKLPDSQLTTEHLEWALDFMKRYEKKLKKEILR